MPDVVVRALVAATRTVASLLFEISVKTAEETPILPIVPPRSLPLPVTSFVGHHRAVSPSHPASPPRARLL